MVRTPSRTAEEFSPAGTDPGDRRTGPAPLPRQLRPRPQSAAVRDSGEKLFERE
jgi:hypothetical protein